MFKNLPPLLVPERVQIIKKIESKKCVFDLLTVLLEKEQSEVDKYEIFDALVAREKLGSTCVGNGIAIPRSHLNTTKPRAALLIIKNGLEIETVDNKPIKIFLAIIAPDNQQYRCSVLIKKLIVLLSDEDNIKTLTNTKSEEFLASYFESFLTEIRKDK